VPRAFARLAVSLLTTSLVALGLIVLEEFSLPRLVAVLGAVTLLGYLGVGRVRHIGPTGAANAGRAGALVFLFALAVYWPALEAHIAGSDASAYLAAGVHLAREHKLSKTDDLGPLVPPIARGSMFFSALGMPWKPPYSRIHGGLVVESLGATEAVPSFFPLPSAWAAMFADSLGARHAGGYAPLFAAAAVWAMWLLARARLGFFAAVTITILVAANAAAYWSGRFALSEPLAWFFIAAALVALDAYEDEGFPADARLAGALLGGAALVRIEYAAFIVAALAIRLALKPTLGGRPLGGGFGLGLGALFFATAAEAMLVPGAYTAPIADVGRGLDWIMGEAMRDSAWLVYGSGVAMLGAFVISIRRFGFVRVAAASTALAFFILYARFSADRDPLRALRWLGLYVGWATLVFAGLGVGWTWRRRFARPADAFVVILFAVVASCLIFDPHVYPAMPWAARRFVPVVIPLGLIFAGTTATAIWRRSVIAGLVAWALLLTGTLAPARALWRGGHFEGTYDQLAELAAALPGDGAVLIDNRLIPMLLGPPLWLTYGRNSLPATLTTTAGRGTVAGMTRILGDAGKGPVLLIKPTLTAGAEPIFFTQMTRVGDLTLQIPLPEETDGAPPQRIERYTQPISIYRLDPVDFPPKP
jgi:hypothetical protein